VNVYMTIAHHDAVLRAAFAAAKAEPWLEGRDAPGYLAFGEPCGANAECAGNLCDGATSTAPGKCNVDCGRTREACPTNLVCSSAGKCDPPEEDRVAPNILTPSRCSLGPLGRDGRGGSGTAAWTFAVVAWIMCRFRSRRSTMRP
jgi:hypothetical protein